MKLYRKRKTAEDPKKSIESLADKKFSPELLFIHAFLKQLTIDIQQGTRAERKDAVEFCTSGGLDAFFEMMALRMSADTFLRLALGKTDYRTKNVQTKSAKETISLNQIRNRGHRLKILEEE